MYNYVYSLKKSIAIESFSCPLFRINKSRSVGEEREYVENVSTSRSETTQLDRTICTWALMWKWWTSDYKNQDKQFVSGQVPVEMVLLSNTKTYNNKKKEERKTPHARYPTIRSRSSDLPWDGRFVLYVETLLSRLNVFSIDVWTHLRKERLFPLCFWN